MKYTRPFLICLLSFALSTPMALARKEAEYRAGELLIRFKSGIGSKSNSTSHANHTSRVARRFRKTGIELVRLSPGLTMKEARELYKQDPNVEYVEPNYRLYASEIFPDDPWFDSLWGLHNTGQSGGTPDADVDAPEAWHITTGSDEIIVAVVDSGVDYNHEDLSANMWINDAELNGTAGLDDDANGYIDDIYGIDTANDDTDPMDDDGHGTLCSGIIGAVGDNGIGVVGVNWHVKLMALKFLDASGSGLVSDAIECLEYAITMKEKGHNVRITSNSWGGEGYSQALYDTIRAAADADILFVTAAGNGGNDNEGPGWNNDVEGHEIYPPSYNLDNIIAVAATDKNDNLASFSNWGPTSIDVAAPGVNVLSSTPGNNYSSTSGTSMATPYVSGLSALIMAQEPSYTWDEVKWTILATVDPLASLEGLVLTGGRINVSGQQKPTLDSISPTAGAYTQVMDLYGSNFGDQREGMDYDLYHGHKRMVTFTHTASGDTWIANLCIWSNTHIMTRFHDLFLDTNGNYAQDAGEPGSTPDDFANLLGNYDVKVKTIYFGDEDSNGVLSDGDTVLEVVSSTLKTFELTDELTIYMITPKRIDCSYKDSSGVHWTVLTIYGCHFGQDQGDGQVCVGPYPRWTNNPLTAGFEEPFVIWSDNVIKVGFVVPRRWEAPIRGKTAAVWVRKGGMYTEPWPLQVNNCDMFR